MKIRCVLTRSKIVVLCAIMIFPLKSMIDVTRGNETAVVVFVLTGVSLLMKLLPLCNSVSFWFVRCHLKFTSAPDRKSKWVHQPLGTRLEIDAGISCFWLLCQNELFTQDLWQSQVIHIKREFSWQKMYSVNLWIFLLVLSLKYLSGHGKVMPTNCSDMLIAADQAVDHMLMLVHKDELGYANKEEFDRDYCRWVSIWRSLVSIDWVSCWMSTDPSLTGWR